MYGAEKSLRHLMRICAQSIQSNKDKMNDNETSEFIF